MRAGPGCDPDPDCDGLTGLSIRSGDGLIMCGLPSGCDACGGRVADLEMESALCSVVPHSGLVAASAEPGAGRRRSGEAGSGRQFMSLPSWSQFAACCADRRLRRAHAPRKQGPSPSSGFVVCPEPETRVDPARSDLPNSRDRDLQECCSRALSGVLPAPRRGLTGRFPRAPPVGRSAVEFNADSIRGGGDTVLRHREHCVLATSHRIQFVRQRTMFSVGLAPAGRRQIGRAHV